jgi:hypothetical protein
VALFRRKPSQKAIRAHLTQLIRAAGTFGSLVGTSFVRWQTPAEARPTPGVRRPLKPEKVDADLRSRISAAIEAALRPHLGEQRRLLTSAWLVPGQSPAPDVKVWVQAQCEGLSGSYTGFSGGHATSSEAVTGALVTLVARLVVGGDSYLERTWRGRVAPREQILADVTHRAPFMAAYEASGFEDGLRAWIGSLLAP